MQVIEFKASDDKTRYALTVSRAGQVLSSTGDRLRATEFTPDEVVREQEYRHRKTERERENDDAGLELAPFVRTGRSSGKILNLTQFRR
jgi:hypothetical protein